MSNSWKGNVIEMACGFNNQGFVVWDNQQRLVSWSTECLDFWYDPADILKPGMPMLDLLLHIAGKGGFGPGDPDKLARGELQRVCEAGRESTDEFQMLDGRNILVQRYLMKDGGHASTYTNITERKKAEQELKQSEGELRSILDNLQDIFYRTDSEGRIIMISPSVENIFGHTPAELIGCKMADFYVNPDERTRFLAELEQGGGSVSGFEGALRHKDGHEVQISTNAHFYRGEDGRIMGVEGTTRDITERKKAERELKESEARFRDYVASASDWFWEQDAEFRFVNIIAFHDLELSGRAKNILGHTRWGFEGINPDQDEYWRRHLDDLSAHRSFHDFRYTTVAADGEMRILSSSGKPVFSDDGVFTGYRGTAANVTELVKAQSSNERFLLALDHLSEGLALWDAEGRLVFCNDILRKITGGAGADLKPGITYAEWLQALLKHDIVSEAVGRQEAWVTERMDYFRHPVGAYEVERNARWYLFRLQRLPDGSTMHSAFDIHDLKLSEEKLRQSQKMEVIGHLAGGVAHDFNNILAVMIGSADLLKRSFKGDEKAGRYIEPIIRAGDRGALLIQRLLAFSRKQPLASRSTAINALVVGLEDMLQRMLGETIELSTRLASTTNEALIDPHQLENALVNLAVNAKDAMPNGGELTIGTANVSLDDAYAKQYEEVTPGDYIEVTVSDTGTGITPAVLENVYEPFFTTKEVGEGSGLGLSMVYGFVKQSNGHIMIHSEVDRGTTVKLYLPRSMEAESEQDTKHEILELAMGSERILVVEDDEDVREITKTILCEQGYEVVEARDGKAAFKLLEDGQAFDLLFTDVILPGGINGFQIAEQVKSLQRNIKVLYTSGYAEVPVAQNAELEADVSLLIKPYHRAELLERVRAILDSVDD